MSDVGRMLLGYVYLSVQHGYQTNNGMIIIGQRRWQPLQLQVYKICDFVMTLCKL